MPSSPTRPVVDEGHAEDGGHRTCSRAEHAAEPATASVSAERRVVPRSASSRGSWRTRSSPLTSHRSRRARFVRAAWPGGNCSTRSSARSSARTAEPRRACHCGHRPVCVCRGTGSSCPTRRRWSPRPRPAYRTFLLADEPGLGKTAQALRAADAANAYPLLVVVPSVVKINWVREASLWTPNRRATAVHGNGDTVDGFADIVVVNYEVLDRHVESFSQFGFRGMVVDEAHFIKNKNSATLAARPGPVPAHPVPHRAPFADGPHRHPADQRHRRLPGHLADPRLDRRDRAARRADGLPRGDRPDSRRTQGSTPPLANA